MGNNQYKHTLSEAQKSKGSFCLTGGDLVLFYSGKYATPGPSVNNKDAWSSSGRSFCFTEEDEETLKMIENKHEVGLSSMDDKYTVDDEYLTTSQKISEADPSDPFRGVSQPS